MAGYVEAITRINTLDRCLSNFGRKYYIDDLVCECNLSLSQNNSDTNGVKKRQIYNDLNVMRNRYSAPIEIFKEGKRTYYRYETKNFRIRNTPITEEEMNYLKSSLEIIKRFNGIPQRDLLDSINEKIRGGITKNYEQIISLDENLDYTATDLITPIFNAIVNKRTLRIEYLPFGRENAEIFLSSPYHLKQYNKRWFLFAKNQKFDFLTTYSLDRIVSVQEIKEKYEPTKIEWEEYFDNVIGVSNANQVSNDVVFWITNNRAKYIDTKPIHGSQKKLKIQNKFGYTKYTMNVVLNFELESLLLSFGSDLIISSPEILKVKILETANKIIKNYNTIKKTE